MAYKVIIDTDDIRKVHFDYAKYTLYQMTIMPNIPLSIVGVLLLKMPRKVLQKKLKESQEEL